MNHFGYAIGNNLEMIEAINALKGKMPQDLGEVVIAEGSMILSLAGISKNSKQNEEKIKEALMNKSAYKKLIQMVSAQYRRY